MALIPAVTCSADIVDVAGSAPRACSLGAAATNSPTGWRWEMLAVPSGSSADSGVNGDFTDGVATIQAPAFTADVAGGAYVLEARAQNADGWSKPGTDRENGQQIVMIKTTKLDLPIPSSKQYNWADYLNEVFTKVEAAI